MLYEVNEPDQESENEISSEVFKATTRSCLKEQGSFFVVSLFSFCARGRNVSSYGDFLCLMENVSHRMFTVSRHYVSFGFGLTEVSVQSVTSLS